MIRSREPGRRRKKTIWRGSGQQQWWECRLNLVSSSCPPLLLVMETDVEEEEIITRTFVFDPCNEEIEEQWQSEL